MCKNHCQDLPAMERCSNLLHRDKRERTIVYTTWFILRWTRRAASPLTRDRRSESRSVVVDLCIGLPCCCFFAVPRVTSCICSTVLSTAVVNIRHNCMVYDH